MKNIKAIAFDLGGVLIKENDYYLSEIAQKLEKCFGKINNNEEFYDWASKEKNLLRKETEKIIKEVIENIYDLRDPDIFKKLPKMKLAIASNHISEINKWIDKANIRNKFYYIQISGDIGEEKPNKQFYEKLVVGINEKPEHILFIDDDQRNIIGAQKVGLSVMLYDSSRDLTEEIMRYLK